MASYKLQNKVPREIHLLQVYLKLGILTLLYFGLHQLCYFPDKKRTQLRVSFGWGKKKCLPKMKGFTLL